MNLTGMLDGIGAGVLAARERAGVEAIITDDGETLCKACGEPLTLALQFTGDIAKSLGERRTVPRNCKCMRDMFAAEDAAMEKQRREREIADRKIRWLESDKYRKSTFSADVGRHPKIRSTCEKYVERYREMIEANLGLAFIGGNGGGKTFWACCIANALIESGASVLMTTLSKLIRDMNADYGEQRDRISRKIKTVDFLIIDDYGAERGTEFSLEQAFEILDMRYSAGKPLIITANLSEDNLKNPPNIKYARSYSRIIEMCPARIEVKGERRQEIAEQKRQELIKLLRDER